ncbi:MAG: hypothetical protein MJ217_02840 [Bacilli bacterium]|nr:hypothetical protein [Bacilli bacterium]
MSEIKGQILGVILVLMIFGAVAGAMTAVFSNLSNTITTEASKVNSSMKTLKFSA